MDRRRKVELFEQIRLGYTAGETILGLARKYGVHRRMVRQAIENGIPPERKPTHRSGHKLDPAKPFIDGILDADKQARRKQRHTAHRIWRRLRKEHRSRRSRNRRCGRYVRKRKRESGLIADEIFVPQSYQLGQEAQVDWYEAIARLGGDERKLYSFSMRSMASGDAFHCAYPHATQQALLDAHEKAFAYFGGVFRTLAEGGYIDRSEPVVLIGECGLRKSYRLCRNPKQDGDQWVHPKFLCRLGASLQTASDSRVNCSSTLWTMNSISSPFNGE
jgi:transposase